MKIYTLLIPLLIMFSIQNASASLFDKNNDDIHLKAENAMAEGNFAIAYCLWESLASKGDSKAQFNIGWMFHNGYGLAINDNSAFSWWLKAAEQGYIEAYYTLADLFLAGFGVDKDKDIAMGWYIAAAELGHKPSLEVIHALKSHSDKLSQKYFKQLIFDDWFLRAAQKGDEASLKTLLSLANKKDKASKEYFSQLLKNHAELFPHKMNIKVARANIRRGPGTQFKILLSLKQNDEVIILGNKGKWSQIGLTNSGQVAWIFSGLLKPSTTPDKTE